MKPKKYPYSGFLKANETTKKDKLELIAFPNIAFKKDMLKHVFSVVKTHDNATMIYFRVYKILGAYEEMKFKINLSYKETIKMLNDVN